jgi:hypothetical protein
MLSQTKYEKITKEAEQLLVSVSGGIISTPRIIRFLKEITGEVKPKKEDRRSILEKRLK